MKTKIFAFFMVFLLALSPMAVFGAEEEYPELTIKDALSKAVSNSNTIKQNQEDKASLEYQIKSAKDSMRESTTTSGFIDSYTSYLKLSLQLTQSDSKTQNLKENLEYTLTRDFAAIIKAEKELELLDKSLELTKAQLDISALKLKLGLISQSVYDAEEYSYQTKVDSRKNMVTDIDAKYRSLNDTMGQNKDKKYRLVLELEYAPLDADFDTSRAAIRAVEQSPTVKSAEQELTTAKYRRDGSLSYNETTGAYQPGTKVNNDNAVAAAGRSLEDAKNNLENDILSAYDAAIGWEHTYDSTVKNLAQQQADLEILKVKLEQGKVTALDVTKAELTIEELEETLRSTIYSHAVAVMPLNNHKLLAHY